MLINKKFLQPSAFFILLLIILGLAVFGLQRIASLNEQTNALMQKNSTKINLINEVNEIASRRAVLLHKAHIEPDPFLRDEYLLEFRYLPVRYLEVHEQLVKLELDDTERQLLKEVNDAARAEYQVYADLVNELEEDIHGDAPPLQNQELFQAMNETISKTRLLINYEQQKTRNDLSEFESVQDATYGFLQWLFYGAFAVGVIISALSYRQSSDYCTEQMDLHHKVEKALSMAENSNAAKTTFLARMSHELRTPLNAIIGFAEILGHANKMGDREQRQISHIQSAGKHLLQLVDEVLDISSIEANKISIKPEDCQLHALLAETHQFAASLERKYQVTFKYNVPSHVRDVILHVDPVRFRQVMINIMSNAAKYNHEHGRVDIEAKRFPDGRCHIIVRDTGPGLSAEDRAHLFEPFERLHHKHGDVEGTGIGLTITRMLVELMGGEIGVDSEPGKGSTFWLEFNIASVPTAQDTSDVLSEDMALSQLKRADH